MLELSKTRILKIAHKLSAKGMDVSYNDFNPYLKEMINDGVLQPTEVGWILFEIRKQLMHKNNEPGDRYYCRRMGRKTVFTNTMNALFGQESK